MASGPIVCTPPRLGETSPSFAESSKHRNSRVNAHRPRSSTNTAFQHPSSPAPRSVLPEQNFDSSNNLKRKGSFSTNDSRNSSGKKRRKESGMVLPTKFLLGGNIHDPLNLESLTGEKNQVTPCSSPLPTPKHKKEVEVLIPQNINDPLNLNNGGDGDGVSLVSPIKGKKKKLRNKRKRTDSEVTIEDEEEDKAEIEVEETLKEAPKERPKSISIDFSAVPATNSEKIVSPAIPQGAPFPRLRKSLVDNAEKVSNELGGKSKAKKSNATKNYRPQDAHFKYGNYSRYYGYRNQKCESDIRLTKFRKEWFENKDILDLGCNAGNVTLTIARNFNPSLIIGIDIDANLVLAARKNIRNYISNDFETFSENFPTSLVLTHGPIKKTPEASVSKTKGFPNNVVFVEGNYVLPSDDQISQQLEEYDCILCLSLTKWIHLNWGDEGLQRAFKRMFAQLRDGGKLILEAQPWCSYKKKHSITVSLVKFYRSFIHKHLILKEHTDKIYKSIRFKPEHFNEYLLSQEVGFKTCELVDIPNHQSKGTSVHAHFCVQLIIYSFSGFRRSIYLFTKKRPSQD